MTSVFALVCAAPGLAPWSSQQAKLINVSVRDVVIDPYTVDGKLVKLASLLHRGPQGDALYWQYLDIQQSIQSHAVAVSLSSSSWPDGAEQSGAYVAVEGILEADDGRPGSEFSGALLAARHAESSQTE